MSVHHYIRVSAQQAEIISQACAAFRDQLSNNPTYHANAIEELDLLTGMFGDLPPDTQDDALHDFTA